MSYITKNLTANETIQTTFNFHWIAKFNAWLIMFIGVMFLLISLAADSNGMLYTGGAFVAFGAYMLLALYKTEQAVTSKRVVLKTGIIGRNTEEMRIEKIETVELKQGIIARMMGYGNVQITGTGNSRVLFRTVKNPAAVKVAIEEIVFG